MRHQLTIQSDDRGLSDITLTVPRGRRADGLALIDRLMPTIRELERQSRGLARREDAPALETEPAR